jgi:hypothetical protein
LGPKEIIITAKGSFHKIPPNEHAVEGKEQFQSLGLKKKTLCWISFLYEVFGDILSRHLA